VPGTGRQRPFTVINELIENLIHAFFCDVVITILDGGRVVRISDHGPGVDDKDRAFLPGFTTATADQRRFIRGVGSGLPIARESLGFLRGAITVEDNLGGGAVVTIKMPQQAILEADAQRRPRRAPALDPSEEDPRAAHGAQRGRPERPRQRARRGPGDRVSRASFTGEDGLGTLARRREARSQRRGHGPPRNTLLMSGGPRGESSHLVRRSDAVISGE
jgi:hypothetical protein